MILENTYNIITFGCQMNERDSETLAGMLDEMGYSPVEDRRQAAVVVLNTCSVRENADKRFFGVLGQLKHSREENPGKIVAICGCMCQQEHITDKIKAKYPWVDLVFGPHNIKDFPEMLNRVQREKIKLMEILPDCDSVAEGLPVSRAYSFKAYVSIMQGCNNFCSYCIVPYTRGREKSRAPEAVLAECGQLAESGCREITLLGQNVNSYNGGISFAELLRRIDEIDGIERIRFMTSHPKDLSDELIACYGNLRHLCKNIHLPVQSGSDKVLREMNRRYDRERYFSLVDKLRAVCPDITISTDIIVGFPGESDADFEDTLDLVRRVRYDSAFTFIYSPRVGTPASVREDQVPEDIKHERMERLLEAVHEIQEEKSKKYQDGVYDVLVEGYSRTGRAMLTGHTEGFKVVDFKGSEDLIGKIVPIRITKAQTFSLYGELIK